MTRTGSTRSTALTVADGSGAPLASEPLDRRDLLKKGLVWGGAGATAATLGTTAAATIGNLAAAHADQARSLIVDVACLGHTLQVIFAPGAHPPSDHAGSLFVVEGAIYEAGTIDGDGFDPSSTPAVGRWFCRGWFVDSAARPQPGVITTQEYLFGEITPQRMYPPDQLVSSGLEQTALPTFDPIQQAIRSVIGGTGRYAGASGVVTQHYKGHNTTKLGPAGVVGPAPNFRFEFQLS
jgi:hypothetical protein